MHGAPLIRRPPSVAPHPSPLSRSSFDGQGSAFHIVMEGLTMLGGDLHGKTGKEYGKGGESIFGYDYEDRSCVEDGAPKHDRPGKWPRGHLAPVRVRQCACASARAQVHARQCACASARAPQ